jgi:hypothetical protein
MPGVTRFIYLENLAFRRPHDAPRAPRMQNFKPLPENDFQRRGHIAGARIAAFVLLR